MILGEPVSFLLFEALGLLLFLVCVAAATKQGELPPTVAVYELMAITLYGLAIEETNALIGLYSYGDFGLMAFDAPLVIGIGWGVILFAAMRLTDRLNMPEWARPFLDALLALSVDFGMDVVAIRDVHFLNGRLTGMWNWGISLGEAWFGVPYWNFAGWWLIVFYMSVCLRLGRWWFGKAGKKSAVGLAYPWLAAVVAVLLGGLHVIRWLPDWLLLILMVALSLTITAATWRGLRAPLTLREDVPIVLVPVGFHVFFLGLMLARGLYRETPAILPIGVGVLVTSLAFHAALWGMSRRSGPLD